MQLYNFDNWYLEGMGILLTVVNLFTTAFFISSILKDRNNSKHPVWKYFILYVVFYAISRINITTYEWRADIIHSAVFLSCFLFSSDKWWKKLLVPFSWVLLNLVVNGTLNSLVMIKFNLTYSDFDTIAYEKILQIINSDVYASFCTQGYAYTALVFVEMMILLFINRKNIKSLEMFLINLFVFILTTVSNVPMYFMEENKLMVITGVVSSMAAVFLMIYSYSRLKFYQEFSKTEAENKFLKEKEAMQLEYYNEMKVKEEQIRKINHDIKNNISVVYGLKNDKDRDKFIKRIDGELKKYEVVKYSSNDILNIILNTKFSKAKGVGIKVEVEVKNSISFMDDIDISNLFTNILDNAIENSINSNKKIIKLKVCKKLDYIVVQCSNSYDGKVLEKDKRFISKKKDAGHGYGLRIVDDIVKKYDGEKSIEYDNDTFTINLLIREADK